LRATASGVFMSSRAPRARRCIARRQGQSEIGDLDQPEIETVERRLRLGEPLPEKSSGFAEWR